MPHVWVATGTFLWRVSHWGRDSSQKLAYGQEIQPENTGCPQEGQQGALSHELRAAGSWDLQVPGQSGFNETIYPYC